MYRAAVIGCGKIGSEFADDPRLKDVYTHAHAYTVCETTTLVAVCDSDAGKLARCAERWQVPYAYRDAYELLSAQQPELVSICTPDATHYELVRAALETPGVRGVLAEKPLALHLAQADELVALAEARGVTLAVNYSRRYADNHARLRDQIQNGALGQLQAIHGFYTKGTLHNGTHWFDLLRYFAGEVVRVWGFDRRGEWGADPTLDAALELENGVIAMLRGLDADAFALFEMDILGAMGRARITDVGHTIELSRAQPSGFYSGYQMLAPVETDTSGMGDVTWRAVQDLAACVETGMAPRCSGRDARAALAIGLAVCNAARLGQPVNVERGCLVH